MHRIEEAAVAYEWDRPEPCVLHAAPVLKRMTDDEFFELCAANRELRIEQTAEGDLIVMPPAGSETGRKNADLLIELGIWARQDGQGICFDSSTGFKLPNGAKRSPDVSWVRKERWEALTPQQRQRFAPLCPDFVVELRSETDRLDFLQEKMAEYLANGARLGWLIDPLEHRVYVYRPNRVVECLDHPATVTGDPELPGFALDLGPIWA